MRRALLALLAGSLLLAHPVVGNGPGPDPVYTFETRAVDGGDRADVEAAVAAVPRGGRVYRDRAVAVREAAAADGAVGTSEDIASALSGLRYVVDDVEGRFYAVAADPCGGRPSCRPTLDARRVPPETVADGLATSRSAVPPPVEGALREGRVRTRARAPSTLVRTDGGYVLVVRRTGEAPDPFRHLKLAAYALGVALLVAGGVSYRERWWREAH